MCVYADRIAEICGDISTNHSLYGKITFIIVSSYISTSGSGVIGGSGAAATV